MTDEQFEKVGLFYNPEKATLTVDYNIWAEKRPVHKIECTIEEFAILLTFITNDPFFDGKVTVEYGMYR